MLAPLVFDSPLLISVLEAVERRGKAIRYHGSLQCTRETEQGLERLNVDLRSTDRIQFRFSLWQDGRFWLTVNKPGPSRTGGWQIDEQVEGDIGRWTPSEIVGRIEASMMMPTDVSRVWHTNASNQAMQRTAPRSDA
jgi:hypothetical protein